MSSFPTANQATICPAKPVCQDGKFAKNKNQLTFFQQLLPQKQIRSSQLTEPLSPRLHISYMEGRVEFFHVTIVHNFDQTTIQRYSVIRFLNRKCLDNSIFWLTWSSYFENFRKVCALADLALSGIAVRQAEGSQGQHWVLLSDVPGSQADHYHGQRCVECRLFKTDCIVNTDFVTTNLHYYTETRIVQYVLTMQYLTMGGWRNYFERNVRALF